MDTNLRRTKHRLYTVPRHEPEVIEAERRRHNWATTEKWADTACSRLMLDGIRIELRWQQADELLDTAEVIASLAAGSGVTSPPRPSRRLWPRWSGGRQPARG